MEARTRALLDRYALASRALARESGERLATEAGQSVEFHDFRPYQRGDELRYVDWRVYARTGRLYTRLHQAERTIGLHLLLDASASMGLGGKAAYARAVGELLAYVAQRDARSQLHVLGGPSTRPVRGRAAAGETARFLDEAPALEGARPPYGALREWALSLPFHAGATLVLVVSDLFDEAPLQPALAALRARGLDAGFLQVVAQDDLRPPEGRLELRDVETTERLFVGPAEVRAYRAAVAEFLRRTREAVRRAGFRHVLLPVPAAGEELERAALAALIREGVLEKR